MSEFAGKAVAIIGATDGVGPAVLEAFLKAGARVAAGILGDGGAADVAAGALAIPIALTDTAAVTRFLDRCEAELGGLDVLVMSPRPVHPGKFLELPPAELRQVIEEELIAVALCLQECARRMVRRGGGRIISFVSMSGKTGVHTGVAPYAAAKGGVIALSRVMAAELAATGVTVNVIATALFEPQVAVLPEFAPQGAHPRHSGRPLRPLRGGGACRALPCLARCRLCHGRDAATCPADASWTSGGGLHGGRYRH